MRYAFAIAALAGAALAIPHYGEAQQEEVEYVKNVHVVVETVYQTVYVTEGYETPKPTTAEQPHYEAPAVTTTTVQEPSYPAPTNYPEQPAPQSTYEAPAPQPTYEAPAPAPPAATGYMATVNEWRSKMGLTALRQDSKLEANALDCVQSSHGTMIHKLNPGTMGQVLAPGRADEFEHVFVGGWLCEMPNLPGLGDACLTQSKGWDYAGQTGHAEILTAARYTAIGCNIADDIWACDLA